jgi:hypothetical protein
MMYCKMAEKCSSVVDIVCQKILMSCLNKAMKKYGNRINLMKKSIHYSLLY